jgi:hypothetical protein
MHSRALCVLTAVHTHYASSNRWATACWADRRVQEAVAVAEGGGAYAASRNEVVASAVGAVEAVGLQIVRVHEPISLPGANAQFCQPFVSTPCPQGTQEPHTCSGRRRSLRALQGVTCWMASESPPPMELPAASNFWSRNEVAPAWSRLLPLVMPIFAEWQGGGVSLSVSAQRERRTSSVPDEQSAGVRSPPADRGLAPGCHRSRCAAAACAGCARTS